MKSPDGLTWGLLRQAESNNFIASFSFWFTDPKLEPLPHAANRAHINSHSVGLTICPNHDPSFSRALGSRWVGSISLRRHIAATSVHDHHPTLDPRIGSIDPPMRSATCR